MDGVFAHLRRSCCRPGEHALGFTLSPKRFPSRESVVVHSAGSMAIHSDGTNEPMLWAWGRACAARDFDESGYPPIARSIIHALKKYGMILQDRGSDMYIAATGDSRWPTDQLRTLWKIMPTDFRVVTTQPRYGYHAYPKQ